MEEPAGSERRGKSTWKIPNSGRPGETKRRKKERTVEALGTLPQ